MTGPRLDQGPVDGDVFVRQQAVLARQADHLLKEALRDVGNPGCDDCSCADEPLGILNRNRASITLYN